MQFIAFIASAMLIALTSQHSVMGLPLNDTLVCSEGMEWINGQCMPINSLNTSIEHGNSSLTTDTVTVHLEEPVTKLTPVKNFGGCPEGWKHGENGICEEIEPSTPTTTEVHVPTTPEFIDRSTTEFNFPSTRIINVKSSTPELSIESTTPVFNVESTTELNIPSTTEFNMKSSTPQISIRLPTEFHDLPTTTEWNSPSTRMWKVKSTTPEINVEIPTEFHDLSTTTELNTPSTRKFKVKSTTPKVDIETPTEFEDLSTTTEDHIPSTRRFKVKSTTLEMNVATPSDYDDLSTTTEVHIPSTHRLKVKSTTPEMNVATPSDYDDLSTTTEVHIPSTRRFKVKSTTPEINVDTPRDYDDLSTTTERDENVGGVDIIKGCPKGTQPDEDGSCVSIHPMNSTKAVTNLKLLLINGSCPIDYKMIQGRCLYIKPKKNLTLYQTDSTINNFHSASRPKSGIDTQSEDELVPVLDDNSCPEGTEYSEFGLCRKRIHATTPRHFSINKSDGDCDHGYQFINGRCVYITQSPRSKSTHRIISTTTPSEDELSVSESTSPVAEE